MTAPNVSLSTALLIAAIAGAVAFAAGRATAPDAGHVVEHVTQAQADPMPMQEVAEGTELPPGHPAINGTGNGGANDMSGSAMGTGDLPAAGEATITWTVPARWKSAPNPSTMRLATFKIPHQAGDSEDAELSVTQVGGDVNANIDRWIGQFDQAGQKTAKRSTRTVHGMKVTVVEIEGAFSGGMGPSKGVQANWALLGGIVESSPMPHFFKMTGPQKSVHAARAELDALLDSIQPRS